MGTTEWMSTEVERYLTRLSTEIEYCDAAEVTVETTEVAYRGLGVEYNRHVDQVSVARVLYHGVWGIASRCGSWVPELLTEAHRMARVSAVTTPLGRVHMAESRTVRGVFRSRPVVPDLDELVALVQYLHDRVREQVRDLNPIVEVILTGLRYRKYYTNSDGTSVTEYRELLDITIYATAGRVTASAGVALARDLEYVKRYCEELAREVAERLRALTQAKVLNPLRRGERFDLVLRPELAGALLHEVAHLLEADRAVVLSRRPLLGYRISVEDLTVVDDPTLEWAAGSYVVDDEGVPARPKTLIENGVVVNLLHTRWTAHYLRTSPTGNARGLFTVPKPMQSNLLVKPGDWRVKEMIEETRRGFLLEGLVRAELTPDNTVVLYPELAWYIEDGEVRHPVKIEKVMVPVTEALTNIEGIGRELGYRTSLEKGYYVSEVVPHLKVRNYRVW